MSKIRIFFIISFLKKKKEAKGSWNIRRSEYIDWQRFTTGFVPISSGGVGPVPALTDESKVVFGPPFRVLFAAAEKMFPQVLQRDQSDWYYFNKHWPRQYFHFFFLQKKIFRKIFREKMSGQTLLPPSGRFRPYALYANEVGSKWKIHQSKMRLNASGSKVTWRSKFISRETQSSGWGWQTDEKSKFEYLPSSFCAFIVRFGC